MHEDKFLFWEKKLLQMDLMDLFVLGFFISRETTKQQPSSGTLMNSDPLGRCFFVKYQVLTIKLALPTSLFKIAWSDDIEIFQN